MSSIYLVYFFGYLLLAAYTEDASQIKNPNTNNVTSQIKTLNSSNPLSSTDGESSEDTAAKCQSNCLECEYFDSCLKCKPDWILSLSDECGKTTNCPENCKICDEGSYCLECNTGSSEKDGECI